MSIATDIGRIATAKQEIKEVVNQDFNKITDETIDQYANKLQETYDEYESYIPWEHAKGSQIEFTKGGNGSYLEECIIEGNTEQITYTGKNLNTYPYNGTTNGNGITFTASDDGTIIINGQNNNNGNSAYYFYRDTENSLVIPAGTYYIIPPSDSTINFVMYDGTSYYHFDASNNYSRTFTEQKTMRLFYCQVWKGNTKQFNNVKIYPMLSTTPATVNDYEPYVGKIPSPSPSYPQEIKTITNKNNINVTGKNLLEYTLSSLKTLNTLGTWNNNVYTMSEVTYTINGDLSIKVNGTANAASYLIINDNINLKSGANYILNGSPVGGAYNTYAIRLYNGTSYSSQTGSDLSFTYGTQSLVRINVFNGTSVNNLVFKPMIRLAGITDNTYQPYQEQTYPIDLIGKNLFNYNIIDVSTITIDNDGTILISGINTANGYCHTQKTLGQLCPNLQVGDTAYLYLNTDFYENGNLKSYIYIGENWGNGKSKEITQTMLDAYVIVYGGYQTTSHLKIMVTKTLDTLYEPYYNYELCKIGDYKNKIKKSTGKNLFDKNNANILYASFSDDGKRLAQSQNARTLYIPCKPNATYTISKISSQRFRLLTTTEVPANTVQGIDYIYKTTETTATITTSANVNYLCVYYFLNGTDTLTEQQIRDSIQIEEGSTATEYEPYGKVWYLNKNIGKVVLDGSEDWQIFLNIDNSNLFRIDFLGYEKNQIIYCNYYKGLAKQSNRQNFNIYLRNDSNKLDILDNRFTTVEDFKTWLSNNPVTVYYTLTAPKFEKIIDNTILINQLNIIEELKTYEKYTAINAEAADTDLNPVLDWTLSSGPAFQKWLNNPTINEEEEI